MISWLPISIDHCWSAWTTTGPSTRSLHGCENGNMADFSPGGSPRTGASITQWSQDATGVRFPLKHRGGVIAHLSWPVRCLSEPEEEEEEEGQVGQNQESIVITCNDFGLFGKNVLLISFSGQNFLLIMILTFDKSARFVFHQATFYNSYNHGTICCNLLIKILKRL